MLVLLLVAASLAWLTRTSQGLPLFSLDFFEKFGVPVLLLSLAALFVLIGLCTLSAQARFGYLPYAECLKRAKNFRQKNLPGIDFSFSAFSKVVRGIKQVKELREIKIIKTIFRFAPERETLHPTDFETPGTLPGNNSRPDQQPAGEDADFDWVFVYCAWLMNKHTRQSFAAICPTLALCGLTTLFPDGLGLLVLAYMAVLYAFAEFVCGLWKVL